MRYLHAKERACKRDEGVVNQNIKEWTATILSRPMSASTEPSDPEIVEWVGWKRVMVRCVELVYCVVECLR